MTRKKRPSADNWNPVVSAAAVTGIFTLAVAIATNASSWMSKELGLAIEVIRSPSPPEDIKKKLYELKHAGMLGPNDDKPLEVFSTYYPNLRIEVLGNEIHRKSITENHKSNPVLMTGGTVKFRLKTETGEAEQFGAFVLGVDASIKGKDILEAVSWNRIGSNEVDIEVRAKNFRGKLPNSEIVRVRVWHLGQHKRGVNEQTQISPPAEHWLRNSLVSVAVVISVFAISSFFAYCWTSKELKEKGKMEITKLQ